MSPTPFPLVALFAAACVGDGSSTHSADLTPPMEPPDHTGQLPPMPPPPPHTGGSGTARLGTPIGASPIPVAPIR